jgi:pyruvyltransferase
MKLRQKLRKISFLKTTYRTCRDTIQIVGDTLKKGYYTMFNIPFVECYYARVHNFGDLFSSDLLRYLGYRLLHVKDYKKSSMSLTGSILQMYKQDFSEYIMGSGFIDERFERHNNQWKVKTIRGRLSKAQCGFDAECLYGDLGILTSVIFPKKDTKKYKLGILPHCVDYGFAKQLNFGGLVKIISARQAASEVAKEIQEYEHIASSSLHGLIFADAFSIPNIHLRFGDKLIGGNHKFQDYYLGMDSEHEFITFKNQSADDIIDRCKRRFSDDYIQKKQNAMLETYSNVLDSL